MTPIPFPQDGFYPHQQMTAEGAARMSSVHRFALTDHRGNTLTFPTKPAALHYIRASMTPNERKVARLIDRRKGLYLDLATGKPLDRQVTT